MEKVTDRRGLGSAQWVWEWAGVSQHTGRELGVTTAVRGTGCSCTRALCVGHRGCASCPCP